MELPSHQQPHLQKILCEQKQEEKQGPDDLLGDKKERVDGLMGLIVTHSVVGCCSCCFVSRGEGYGGKKFRASIRRRRQGCGGWFNVPESSNTTTTVDLFLLVPTLLYTHLGTVTTYECVTSDFAVAISYFSSYAINCITSNSAYSHFPLVPILGADAQSHRRRGVRVRMRHRDEKRHSVSL